MRVLDLAEKVLLETKELMTSKMIYYYAVNNHKTLVEQTFNGNTPWYTLGAALYTNVKRQDSVFVSYKFDTAATRFGLKSIEYGDIDSTKDKNHDNNNNSNWDEIDLHKYLVSFMSIKDCYLKTINANCSHNKVKDKNTWLHPDLIGVKFFKQIYDEKTISLMKSNNELAYELYSFEMKKTIDLSTLNDKFFQAASNSSWANYGYIVAKDIDEENQDLIEKLEKLNRIFGIGVIKINPKTFSESKILFEAIKREIDYNSINDLISLDNQDINAFFDEIVALCSDLRTRIVSDVFDEPFDSDTDGEKIAKEKGIIDNQ